MLFTNPKARKHEAPHVERAGPAEAGRPGRAPEPQAQVLEAFFARLRRASLRVLMLDYDGTLAPFRVKRDHARPFPGILEAIDRIARDERNRIIVVTGRKISNFQAISGFPDGLEIWGSHGWEHQCSNGAREVLACEEHALAGLIRAEARLARNGLAERVELKPGCLEFHWRGLPDERVEELRGTLTREWAELTRGGGLSIHEFDGGMSLRVPGRDKGTAVRAVLSRLPADAPAAFLGDDETDEDAFGAMTDPCRLGALVRTEYRMTGARAWLRPPGELLKFLGRWSEAGMNR